MRVYVGIDMVMYSCLNFGSRIADAGMEENGADPQEILMLRLTADDLSGTTG